jgi:hypothetical protein
MPIAQDLSSQGLDRLVSPVPIVDDTSLYVDVITAETNNTTPVPMTAEQTSNSTCVSTPQHRVLLAPTPLRSRPNPLPVFPWADSHEIWETMMSKEDMPGYKRDHRWFARHPALQPRLRTVLLDWLMEVLGRHLCNIFYIKSGTVDIFIHRDVFLRFALAAKFIRIHNPALQRWSLK